ncbi:YhdH/YhfP family quinone oxidoreductase [Facklamia miroungae]|uniref:Putative quinone oxidoreductase, YhdH/YhfP family n=1 Tax=Facklamia miroungae TaxID=120956 RepID=A0A1G7TD37_9LACT|nr:YhdH/YhfP family quinone oxidoreductase [Facklamia miroungae]NKZ29764.1 YhdH/YhfP family quinone oxidoreductase [Facklamia miroungae]SDG32944.1 putative quinone oxidoreductase, YhdH/YhfP family [Facklamia miroungae]
MNTDKFKAMVVTETKEREFKRAIKDKIIQDLPEGDVLINVKFSSLNYKDALSSIGNKGVTREYPHTPGIDAAGVIVASENDMFTVGEEVIVTGYDLGMNTSGGFQQYIRVPSDWIVKLPENLSLKESMIYGTAGFTAALSVYRLIQSGVKPEDGKILVTGATGGVGSTAISILSKLNYRVTAATGKLEKKEMLLNLGAKEIIDRPELDDQSGKALLKGQWAGVIDTVGGNLLSTAIKSVKYGGSVTCCGNVISGDLSTSIYPFILRGVSLLGIDSVQCDLDTRRKLWDYLANDWKIDHLTDNVEEVSLEDLDEKINLMLEGKHTGRTILNLSM